MDDIHTAVVQCVFESDDANAGADAFDRRGRDSETRRGRWTARAATVGLLLGIPALAQDDERANFFGDPFLQVTSAIAGCPEPEGPRISREQMRAQSHARSERGTSCFQSGRCRLPNAYLYDKEIIPRVKKAIDADGRFGDTSVWAEGQRRWVWLKGCVREPSQAQALEQLVRGLDDVENVISELVVMPR